MKYYTAPLMNEVKKRKKLLSFFLGDWRRNIYYQARHKEQDIFLMWIEGSNFGKVICYPCVLARGEEALVFEAGKLEISLENNEKLIQAWEVVVTPENIHEEFEVTELDNKAFGSLFAQYRRRHLDAEMEKVMQEEILAMEPEQREEAQQALDAAKIKNQEQLEELEKQRAEKEAQRKKKQKATQEEEDIQPEVIEDIQDETLKQALLAAREQANKEEAGE